MNPVIDKYSPKFWTNDEGQFHRLDGPAIEYADGSKEWWIDGILYTHEQLLEYLLK